MSAGVTGPYTFLVIYDVFHFDLLFEQVTGPYTFLVIYDLEQKWYLDVLLQNPVYFLVIIIERNNKCGTNNQVR